MQALSFGQKMKRHITHFDDCGCLTERYKYAINALFAIQKHMEIVMGKSGSKMSTVEYIVTKAIDSINGVDLNV